MVWGLAPGKEKLYSLWNCLTVSRQKIMGLENFKCCGNRRSMCFPPFLPGNKISQKQIDATNVTILLKTVWLQNKKLLILFKHWKKKLSTCQKSLTLGQDFLPQAQVWPKQSISKLRMAGSAVMVPSCGLGLMSPALSLDSRLSLLLMRVLC